VKSYLGFRATNRVEGSALIRFVNRLGHRPAVMSKKCLCPRCLPSKRPVQQRQMVARSLHLSGDVAGHEPASGRRLRSPLNRSRSGYWLLRSSLTDLGPNDKRHRGELEYRSFRIANTLVWPLVWSPVRVARAVPQTVEFGRHDLGSAGSKGRTPQRSGIRSAKDNCVFGHIRVYSTLERCRQGQSVPCFGLSE